MLLALLLACPSETTTDTTSPTGETDSPTADTDAPTGSTADTTDTGSTGSCGQPTLEIGTGAEAHTPLQDDDPVRLVSGDQGGWHIDISGLITNTTSIVSVLPTVTRVSDGLQIAGDQPPAFLALVGTQECEGTFHGVRAYIDDHVYSGEYVDFICTLGGEALELHVQIEDLKDPGSVAERTVRVIAVNDPADACP